MSQEGALSYFLMNFVSVNYDPNRTYSLIFSFMKKSSAIGDISGV